MPSPCSSASSRSSACPKAIRTDNGVPFASPNALFGLSKLSVWWLRLGIEIERIWAIGIEKSQLTICNLPCMLRFEFLLGAADAGSNRHGI